MVVSLRRETAGMSKDIIPRQLLEQFIVYISDNWGTGKSSLGLELEFYERNNFAPSIANRLYRHFHQWVNGFESPLAISLPDGSFAEDGRDAKYVRAIAIQLRNYFRAKFGRAPLTEEEIAQFAFNDIPALPNQSNRPRAVPGSKAPVYRPTDDELRRAAYYTLENYPDIVAYSHGLRNLAPMQGYSHLDVDGRGITLSYAFDALCGTLPPLQTYYDVRGAHDVLDLLDSESFSPKLKELGII